MGGNYKMDTCYEILHNKKSVSITRLLEIVDKSVSITRILEIVDNLLCGWRLKKIRILLFFTTVQSFIFDPKCLHKVCVM